MPLQKPGLDAATEATKGTASVDPAAVPKPKATADPRGDGSSPPVQSLFNLMAVALAHGTGDPQVIQQVAYNLAVQRQREDEIARAKTDFANNINMEVYREQLRVAGTGAADLAHQATPAGKVETASAMADLEGKEITNKYLPKKLETEQQAAEQAVARGAEEVTPEAQAARKRLQALNEESLKLQNKIADIESQAKQRNLDLVNNVDYQDAILRKAQLDNELTQAQTVLAKSQATRQVAEAKAAGGKGKSFAEAYKIANSSQVVMGDMTRGQMGQSPPSMMSRISEIQTLANMPDYIKNLGPRAGETISQTELDAIKNQVADPILTIQDKLVNGDHIGAYEWQSFNRAIGLAQGRNPGFFYDLYEELVRSFAEGIGIDIDSDPEGADEAQTHIATMLKSHGSDIMLRVIAAQDYYISKGILPPSKAATVPVDSTKAPGADPGFSIPKGP